MSNPASPVTLAPAVETAFRPVGRRIWCQAQWSPSTFFRAEQIIAASAEEAFQLTEKQLREQSWKIEILNVSGFRRDGFPHDYKVVKEISAPVKLTENIICSRNRFSYDRMMELMTGFYSPSTPDPTKRFPNHISDEIEVWQRFKRLAEIRAREEYGASPRR